MPAVWRAASALGLVTIVPWAIAYPVRRHAASGQWFGTVVLLTFLALAAACAGFLANVLNIAATTAGACYALAPTVMLVMIWANFLYRLDLFVHASKR